MAKMSAFIAGCQFAKAYQNPSTLITYLASGAAAPKHVDGAEMASPKFGSLATSFGSIVRPSAIHLSGVSASPRQSRWPRALKRLSLDEALNF